MKIGIVGLPNVGKSTLFKALTKSPVDINNYPFCTIEPNVGIVKVPDERLWKLSRMSKSEKTIPAVVEFVDIAGLVKGASTGEGLGNKFLANIREVDAICQVVRVFQNEKITHVHNKVDPFSDIEVINSELILADLETTKKAQERLEKEIKKQDKKAIKKLEVLSKINSILESGELANSLKLNLKDKETEEIVEELHLLTMKPFIYVYNVSDVSQKLDEKLEKKDHVKLDIKIEEELAEMTDQEAKEMGMESNLGELIKKSYSILGLITFLTSGAPETRAWTIKKNSTAPQAGAAIHTDFEEKFIRAEIIHWDKLLEAGSWTKAREKGWVRLEGKEYTVQDGDVIIFKI